MVNPVNGSGTQQVIANPFQQRQTNNDDKQTSEAGKSERTAQASRPQQQSSSRQAEQPRQQIANNSNQPKPQNAGRGRVVDITV